jgi:hypothetical protein
MTNTYEGDDGWQHADVRRIFANFGSRRDRPEALADAALALYLGGYDDWIDDLGDRAEARGLDPDTIQICLKNARQRAADRELNGKQRHNKDKEIIDRELNRHNGIYQSAKGGLGEQAAEPPPELEEWDAGNDPGPISPRQ